MLTDLHIKGRRGLQREIGLSTVGSTGMPYAFSGFHGESRSTRNVARRGQLTCKVLIEDDPCPIPRCSMVSM